MQYFLSVDNRAVVLRFDHGDLLLEGLEQVAEELELGTAAIVTGFGALSRLHIHYGLVSTLPPQSGYVVYEQPLELCSLTGLIADNQVHAHITASNGRETFGGHLEPETVVAYLVEVVLQHLPLDLTREKDEHGLPLLRKKW